MKTLRLLLPLIAGAVAGAIVALIVTSGGNSTRTVTTVLPEGNTAQPASVSPTRGISVNAI